MRLEEVYQFFATKPVTFLSSEQAVCYVLSVLLVDESYGTELIQLLEQEYPNYKLSDTVLYNALNFLENEGAVIGYWKKMVGRGRPRRMYQVNDSWRMEAYKLAHLWINKVSKEQQW